MTGLAVDLKPRRLRTHRRRERLGLAAIIALFLRLLALGALAQNRIGDAAADQQNPAPSTTQSGAQASAAPAVPAEPATPSKLGKSAGPGMREHTVAPGETLAAIAVRYQVPFEQIAAGNAIADPNQVRAGRTLTLWPAQPGVVVIDPGATLSDYAKRFGRSIPRLMRLNPQLHNPDRITAGASLKVSST